MNLKFIYRILTSNVLINYQLNDFFMHFFLIHFINLNQSQLYFMILKLLLLMIFYIFVENQQFILFIVLKRFYQSIEVLLFEIFMLLCIFLFKCLYFYLFYLDLYKVQVEITFFKIINYYLIILFTYQITKNIKMEFIFFIQFYFQTFIFLNF